MPAVNANLVRLGEAEAVGGTIRTSACDKRAGQELTSYRLQTQSSFNFTYRMGFTGGSAGKESACNVGDLGSISGLGRSPGEGKGYPLQYSGLENSMDCIVHEVAKSWTRLSDFHFHLTTSRNGGHLNKHTARQGQRIMKHIGSFQTSDKKAVHSLEFTGHSRTPLR